MSLCARWRRGMHSLLLYAILGSRAGESILVTPHRPPQGSTFSSWHPGPATGRHAHKFPLCVQSLSLSLAVRLALSQHFKVETCSASLGVSSILCVDAQLCGVPKTCRISWLVLLATWWESRAGMSTLDIVCLFQAQKTQ